MFFVFFYLEFYTRTIKAASQVIATELQETSVALSESGTYGFIQSGSRYSQRHPCCGKHYTEPSYVSSL